MRLRVVARALGFLSLLLAASLLFPLLVSLLSGMRDLTPFLATLFAAFLAGGAGIALGRREELALGEAFAVVVGTWVLYAAVGALPFWLSGAVPSYTDAFFEAMSGFTTTGSSVIPVLEPLSPPVQFWRCFTQWLGGMGIVVLSVALLPIFGVSGFHLLKAEAPGPIKEKLVPRIGETAKLLWIVYVGLTLAETALLTLFGMPPWEALLHSLTTLATGGYSPKTASIAAYPSPMIQWTIILFMFLAGANFGLHYLALRGQPGTLLRNAEFRLYGAVSLAGGLLLAVVLWAVGLAAGEGALRAGFFQAVSILTTTGYATEDFGKWPAFAQGLLLLFMFLGGCSGSTGGGIKHIRFVLLFRVAGAHIRSVLHPLSVVHVRADGHTATPEELRGVEVFLFLYIVAWAGGSLALALLGSDLLTALSAAATALGNVGPGLGTVGPAANFAHLPALSKWILSVLMLLGRLEVIPIVALFSRAVWGR